MSSVNFTRIFQPGGPTFADVHLVTGTALDNMNQVDADTGQLRLGPSVTSGSCK